MTQRNFKKLLQLIDQKDRSELKQLWDLISSAYKDTASRTQLLVDWLFNKYFQLDKPLSVKGITHHEYQYLLDNFMYVSTELAEGFQPHWMITYRYLNPDDKVRPQELDRNYNKKLRVGKYVTQKPNHSGLVNNVHEYMTSNSYLHTQAGHVNQSSFTLDQYLKQTRERIGFSCSDESNYDKWMKQRYSDIDEIVADTRQVNKRIMRNLFGVRKLNTYGYALPNLYYFHEKGKGRNRHDCPHHTHLLLPKVPYHDKRDLEQYFNSDKRFRSLKCLSHQEIKVSKIDDARGIFNYLCKENSLNHVSLDPTNSTTIQRRNNEN